LHRDKPCSAEYFHHIAVRQSARETFPVVHSPGRLEAPPVQPATIRNFLALNLQASFSSARGVARPYMAPGMTMGSLEEVLFLEMDINSRADWQ